MLSVVRAVFPVAFFVLWPGGAILLLVRARVAQNAYLRRFEELATVPLDGIPLGVSQSAWATIWEAMWEQQFDPEREGLRREMWVRFRWMAAWIFGFPLTVVAIMVLVIITGHGAWLG